ncbi:MAG: hypothetical protein MZV63_55135 [Marinilabiliales bacterium]|nr:hypothetical protein [Marinilabiliales bacterium]
MTANPGVSAQDRSSRLTPPLFCFYWRSCRELSSVAPDASEPLSEMVTTTLDAMMLRGLNDHLQGGIYRYCVDREWTIPHFEKMLYDQAMALWSYSLGYKVTGKEHYRTMAEKIVKCLDETFEHDGLFTSRPSMPTLTIRREPHTSGARVSLSACWTPSGVHAGSGRSTR